MKNLNFIKKNKMLIDETNKLFKKNKKKIFSYLTIKKDIYFSYFISLLIIIYIILSFKFPDSRKIFKIAIIFIVLLYVIYSFIKDNELMKLFLTRNDVEFYIHLWEYVKKNTKLLDRIDKKNDKDIIDFFKNCMKLHSLYEEYKFNINKNLINYV